VVLLDIRLPDMNGYELLQRWMVQQGKIHRFKRLP
jgi:CheY-like chemotaxis protein